MNHCKYFSLDIDDCTVVSDKSQLLTGLLAGIIDEDFLVHERLVKLQSLKDDSRDSDINFSLKSDASEYGRFEKCSCVVTVGSKAMAGSNVGIVGVLKENGLHCITPHGIIHQEAL
ncbi:uncharacterized protein [Palaemon carinicauda]|uniref:uncharacterized protein n=1 Tax=Palaemon carinicauda TaxID=392227 RepID=UPI0035B62CB5